VTRFSGREAPVAPAADAVTREAYSHELISFGFWAGDRDVREAAFYSYTAPNPKTSPAGPYSRPRHSGSPLGLPASASGRFTRDGSGFPWSGYTATPASAYRRMSTTCSGSRATASAARSTSLSA
jgi:Family of unknown function (DUF5996)